ncbi:hypothetical protein FQA39_LY00427 [Lamprigera yunnana]|nr:hypothetical protein FQA39_LY00427 [Lamprigera yunnana]
MHKTPERVDIVLFGATGVTGEYTAPYIYRLAKEKSLTWGVAGRSEQKLKDVLKKTADRVGVENLNDIPIFIADASNEGSILKMTSRARVIVNCCGPFLKYGEVVVKNCVASSTHHVDVSGEPYFHEIIHVKYSQAAEQKGVYLIIACGYDSVASDAALAFLTEKFQGTLNSMEIYVAHQSNETSHVNYGTWETAVNSLPQTRKFFKLHKSRNLPSLPDVKPKLNLRLPFSKAKAINEPRKWITPVPSPDYYVIQRSQRYFYENDKKRPAQVKFYLVTDSWIYILSAIFSGLLLLILCRFKFGRNLLLKYPEKFTNGYITRNRLKEEDIGSDIHMSFYGKGWSEEFDNVQYQSTIPPNKTVLAKLVVNNPGYKYTCLTSALAAVTLLTETSKLRSNGGVLTPSVAFQKTTYMNEILRRSNPIEIIEMKDI